MFLDVLMPNDNVNEFSTYVYLKSLNNSEQNLGNALKNKLPTIN